jgi:hypothetical protein
MTALNRNSKADTAFFSEPNGAGAAALATDISQARTNLTNNTTYVSETNSARTAIAYPREVSIVVNLTNVSSGVLLYHGGAASYGYRVRVNAGAIEVAEGGSTLVSVTIPGMIGTARKVMVHWSERVDGGSLRSEVLLYNFTTGAYAYGTATHSVGSPSNTDSLIIGAAWGGATTFSGGVSAFFAVRVGRRFHSTTEAKEDWILEATPPAISGRRRKPLLTFPQGELPIAGEGQLAGPSYLWAGAATRQADSRLITPLVNVVPRNPTNEDNSYSPTRMFRDAPDDNRYHWCVRYLFHAFASPKTNKARVRINVRCFHSSGGTPIAACYFRMYSVANLPLAGQGMPPPLKFYKSTTVAASTTPSTLGVWLDLGTVQIARDDKGLSYFILGFSIGLDTGAPVESLTAFRVRAITVEPYFGESDNGGFDADVGLGG